MPHYYYYYYRYNNYYYLISDMEQATECLLVLSIILSTNTVIQTVLYISKIPLMSGQKASLYLAIVSAIISSK